MDELLKTAPKVDSISAQLLLREAYEISYLIFDHNRHDAHPWSLCLQQPQEDYTNYSPLYRTINSYRLRDIHSRFGLSVTEFLDLPREFVTLMVKIADIEMAEKSRDLDNAERELRDSFRE